MVLIQGLANEKNRCTGDKRRTHACLMFKRAVRSPVTASRTPGARLLSAQRPAARVARGAQIESISAPVSAFLPARALALGAAHGVEDPGSEV